MEKTIIMPGQFVTFENAIYKAKNVHIQNEHFPKTRRCKRV